MKEKILDIYLENVIESKDFASMFHKLENLCMNKGTEGSFGALIKYSGKNPWYNDFEIIPKLNMGDDTSVLDGLTPLINTYSESKLAKPLEEVAKIAPYFDIHNHPNGILTPSFQDLLNGFRRLNLTKGNPYFSMIVSNSKDNVFPLLLIKFNDFLGERENIEPDLTKEYSNILNGIKQDFDKRHSTPEKLLLNSLFNEPQKVPKGISWDYFNYNLSKRKIK